MANGFNNDDFSADGTISATGAVSGASASFTGAVGGGQLNIDNIRIDGNTISSTDTNGNINITPDGTGSTIISGVSFTELDVDNLNLNGNTLSTTDTNGDLILAPDGSGDVQVLNTDAGSGAGPLLDLYRNSASPAASDSLGQLQISGENSGAAKFTYVNHFHQIATATASSEDGRYVLQVSDGGSLRNAIDVEAGATDIYGTIDGTAKGAGVVGEVLSATNNAGTALTNSTTANVTSVSVTPGVWEIEGKCAFATSGTVSGAVQWIAVISASNASLTGVGNNNELGQVQIGGAQDPKPISGNNNLHIFTQAVRVNVSSTTTYYLNCRGAASSTFTNVDAKGEIKALRVG